MTIRDELHFCGAHTESATDADAWKRRTRIGAAAAATTLSHTAAAASALTSSLSGSMMEL